MLCVPEEHRPSSKPFSSAWASNRRPWKVSPTARMAGTILLLVWVGPVTFAQTDAWQLVRWAGAPGPASAESRVIPAGKAMLLEPGTRLKLHLRDGSVLEGRFLGRTLLDSALYAPRFAAKARSSPYVPLALGETLLVSLRDGREWTAPFSGYGELTLLLRSPDGPQHLRVPFESASEIRRATGDRVEPSALAQAFHANMLPSAEALALEQGPPMEGPADRWAGALRVAVEDIEWVIVELPSVTAKGLSGTDVAGIVVLSLAVSVVVVLVVLKMLADSANSGCRIRPIDVNTQAFSGVRLTTRPFDRSRGCYVDDPLAVADAWPGPTEGGLATAMADPATSAVLAK